MENGKAAIARDLLNGRGFGSTEFHVLSPVAGVLAEWIFYLVRQFSFRMEAKARFTGTAGQLRVPVDFLEEYLVPLPPLPEQHCIIAKLDALFAESRTARTALDAIPAALKRYRQAILAAAFRGQLTTPDPTDEPASVLLVVHHYEFEG
jgi:type I restriction enzyme S subunit